MIEQERSQREELEERVCANRSRLEKLKDTIRTVIEENSHRRAENSMIRGEIDYYSAELERRKGELHGMVEAHPESLEYLKGILIVIDDVKVFDTKAQMEQKLTRIRNEKEAIQRRRASEDRSNPGSEEGDNGDDAPKDNQEKSNKSDWDSVSESREVTGSS